MSAFNAELQCGAKSKRTGEPCRQWKGHRTDHPGSGNCWLHGGRSPNGRKHARRTKLTDPRKLAILSELRRGGTRTAAAGVAQVSRPTFYNWISADLSFLADVEKAESDAEAYYLKAIFDAVPTTWQAAAWWLERRKHMDFARHEKVEMAIDLRAEAQKTAEKLGLDADAVMAQAEAILAGR